MYFLIYIFIILYIKKPLEDNNDNNNKKTDDNDNISLLEYLEIYQYCLVLLLQKVLNKVNITDEDIISNYNNNMKKTWFAYLNKWSDSDCSCRCNLKYSFYNNKRKLCKCELNSSKKNNNNNNNNNNEEIKTECAHPLHLTKPLMLGFVAVVIVEQRNGIVFADLVRWCESGCRCCCCCLFLFFFCCCCCCKSSYPLMLRIKHFPTFFII